MTAGILQRTTRTPLLLVPGVVVLAAIVAAASLVALSSDSAPTDAPPVRPVQVTSGGEIATGFGVGRDRVMTVAHVVDGAVRVSGIRATVLRVDRRSDLALLGVPGAAGRAPRVAATDAGDQVRMLRLRDGRSSPQSVRVRRAIVAQVRALGAERSVTRPALELSAEVRAGDSGAPLMSRSGAIVGVVFAESSARANTAYAVDAIAVTHLLAHD
jgi:S1-C subfamily serine protease